jgi:NADP-dependent 3-hydroxy acid dehydrogenase YdfG
MVFTRIRRCSICFKGTSLHLCSADGSPDDLKKMMDLNVLGLSVCTQHALKSMKERGVDDGHIIHINR